MNEKELKTLIKTSISSFADGNPTNNSLSLFKSLGYTTDRQSPFREKTHRSFKDSFLGGNTSFKEEKALVKDWKYVDLLFQLTKDELAVVTPSPLVGEGRGEGKTRVDRTIIETYLFFVIELTKDEYSRTELSQITREINKVFPMPVMILFKYGGSLTLSVVNRRLHKKDERKDVLEKVTLIKDINIENPHRAHIEILFDLSIEELQRVHKFTNFVELHNAWQKTLDVKELNNKFYKELSNWYFWAMHEVVFPGASLEADKHGVFKQEEKVREHNAKNLIRLLTRILFVWFIKEKNLIPDELFDENYIRDHLVNGFEPRKKKDFDHKTKGSKYYRAILQNLFFATLNQTVGKRDFRKSGQNMNVTNLMRYQSYFKDSNVFLRLVEDIVPFMNGGLFECLDSPDPIRKGKQGGDVIIYEDGFSDRPDNKLCVPDYVFFGTDEHADLSEELGDKKQKDVAVSGLINILKSYKFTVAENTPIEEDVALDPELLGRVFENLLASYNPETKTTARKQTGSFYTPREIVNYMVDESLKAYLKQKLEAEAGMKPEDAQAGLDLLIGYNEKEHLFDEEQTAALIRAIDNCKILDPACGSGAFPMGILHKLVHILEKLDPQNKLWKERQIEKAMAIDDANIRDQLIEDIETAFSNNELDYGRKLYLIENCIYGVDIQPIATQISKLRVFISLIVDQKSNRDKSKNYGIRPLPNLETKFVAANTLIGIEKPKAQGSLFDNQEVKKLEDRLKDVRHRLFSAKTPSTKRKLRDDDKSIREKMSDLLVANGWGNESARQLAGWDPYDQNISSSFFDTEWMFGVCEGFDVVIGNPPYGADIQKLFREYDARYHDVISNYGEIYKMFYKAGFLFLNTSGILSYITSNTFISQPRYQDLRKYLINNTIKSIVNLGLNVFSENVVVPVCLCFLINKTNDDSMSFADLSCDSKFNGSFESLSFKKIQLREILSSKDLSFYTISASDSSRAEHTFDDVLEIKDAGIQYHRSGIGLKNKGGNDLYERIFSSNKNDFKQSIPTWYGKLIESYTMNAETDEFFNIGYKQALKDNESVSFSMEAFSVKIKILWRQTASRLIATIDNEGRWFRNTIQCAWVKETFKQKILLEYCLALCNSNVMAYYYNQIVRESGRVFPQVKIKHVKKLPFLCVDIKTQIPFVCLVSFLLVLNNKNSNSKVFLSRIIDAMVYELYFTVEIKAAGAEVLKYLNKLPELKDNWDDEKKLAVIEKVYKELSDPAHPVNIAMAKQQQIPEVRIIEGKDNKEEC